MSQPFQFINKINNIEDGFTNVPSYDAIEHIYSCDQCNIVDEHVFTYLDLIKDGKSNWTICSNCQKEVQYKKQIIRIKEFN